MFARRYADADRTCARLLALSPQWAGPYNDAAILEIVARGDLARAQAFLDEGGRVPGLKDDNSAFAGTALEITVYRRDYRKALQQLEAQAHAGTPSDQFTYSPISLFLGSIHRLAGDGDLARESFEAARRELEQKVAQDPEDFRLRSSLGIAYAGLGRREDAVRQARLACELMPASKDAFRTVMPAYDLAKVYTMVGMTSEAIAALDDLLERSGLFSVHDLRLNPTWDPQRTDPRFQVLLTKYEVRE
jgi:serine/threonine-protein kinase